MRFLTTLLTATAVCAAMLAAAAYRVGDLPAPEPWAGLTTATVLGSNGTADGGGASGSPLDRHALGTLVDEASRADRDSAHVGGSRG
ncbi:hypothetical protein JCM2811A_19640 [Methylorubrum rhodinum]